MEQLEKHRRPRRTKQERLEEELLKTEETIAQYTTALSELQERQTLSEEIENEQIREVTRLLKEKNLSVGQLKELLSDKEGEDEAEQGA